MTQLSYVVMKGEDRAVYFGRERQHPGGLDANTHEKAVLIDDEGRQLSVFILSSRHIKQPTFCILNAEDTPSACTVARSYFFNQ
jgi:hypothetical protein